MDFIRAVRELVAQIPRDRVSTCGDVADALGDRAAARAVRQVVATRGRRWPGSGRVITADGQGVVSRAEVGRPRFTNFRGGGILTRLRREQTRLAGRNRLEDRIRNPSTVTGVDVSYEGDRAFAAAVTWDLEKRIVVEGATATVRERFPYIPGYLAYREFPAARAALLKLRHVEVVLVDAHGMLHPARFGFACYLGMRLGIPSIGVAKSPLVPGSGGGTVRTGEAIPILDHGALSGFCWRPAAGRPIYISPGHAVSAMLSMTIVRRCTSHRIPDPLREAHRSATEYKRKRNKKGKRFPDPVETGPGS